MMQDIVAYLKRWRLFVGKAMADVPPFSIVLLPVSSDTLFCGLAGVIALKGAKTYEDMDILDRLKRSFEGIRIKRIDKVVEGSAATQTYLSPEDLPAFEEDLYLLKQDSSLQHGLINIGQLDELKDLAKDMHAFSVNEDRSVEKNARNFPPADLEIISGRLIALKDIVWALENDLLSNQEKIASLSGDNGYVTKESFAPYKDMNLCLNALDRLEVRGRDSSGLQMSLFFDDDKELNSYIDQIKDQGLYNEVIERSSPGDIVNRSINITESSITFTYKTALVTGELGENTASLRQYIRQDGLLKEALMHKAASRMYLAHTRWASVGAINETNCHPVNNHTVASKDRPGMNKTYPKYPCGPWAINVALNGDIDNHNELLNELMRDDIVIDKAVTTDTKAIPLQIEHYLYQGHDLKEAFRLAVNDFEGSHAISMQSNLEPGKVYLALKGSGQSIYIGLCNDKYIFSSEVYGLVEETRYFVKMDGEACRIPGDQKTRGQIYVLHEDRGAGIDGIEALYYDGFPLEITGDSIKTAEITTRDIDRGDHPHYLLKEILDSPQSVRKTLRGKYRFADKDSAWFNIDETIFPDKIRQAIMDGRIRNIYVIGQGTAAVAASAIAEASAAYLRGSQIAVHTKKASELSGFCMDDDMSDTLVIAITQSGTTTDTNRAVDMARLNGAHLIAIVNRRQSDITQKAHGVFYTSDGRDIEMSVASTKAFYSQIIAGYVLSLFMADIAGTLSKSRIASELKRLEQAPGVMDSIIDKRDLIKRSAWNLVRQKQYWAVVGSGSNKVASDEIRIKLSELCYKTISSDIIEDKKHIDLSSEPLIMVCAAGTPDIVLDDIIKDVAIFKAHAASVVVIADEGEDRFGHIADSVIHVPKAAFPLSVIENTVVGHIWGYYAACSLDEMSATIKGYRRRISDIMKRHISLDYSLYESLADKDLQSVINGFGRVFHAWRTGKELSTLGVDTATDISLLLKYCAGKLPVEDFRMDFDGKRTSPSPIDMLDITLGKSIDELSRPVDAIRHQAKTVTVGTSRRIEAPGGIIFDAIKALGFSIENLSAKNGVMIKRLQDVTSRIKGHTFYMVEGLDSLGKPDDETTIRVIGKDGIAGSMHSRAEDKSMLMGAKRTIVRTGEIYAGAGRSDNASIIIIPLLGPEHIISDIVLLHVVFNDDIDAGLKKAVLGEKFNDIRNLVNECNIDWDDMFIGNLPVQFLLGEDVEVIANRIILEKK